MTEKQLTATIQIKNLDDFRTLLKEVEQRAEELEEAIQRLDEFELDIQLAYLNKEAHDETK